MTIQKMAEHNPRLLESKEYTIENGKGSDTKLNTLHYPSTEKILA